MGQPVISVVICTYNPTDKYLERAIDSVLRQRFNKRMFEFFLVDNNSHPPVSQLPSIVRNRLKVFHEPKPGLTAARENAVAHAQGEILVFVDDDIILAEDYLARVYELFRNPGLGVLSGQVEPEYETAPPPWFRRFEPMLALRKLPAERLYLTSIPEYTEYFPIGAGISVRKKILEDYFASLNPANRIEGRVGTSLSSGEDIDIDLFALSRGYCVGIAGMLRMTHIIPTFRLQPKYLQRLAVSSLESSFKINQKWKDYFHQDVFTYFSNSRIMTLFKVIFYGLLYPATKYRILFAFHRKLYMFLH